MTTSADLVGLADRLEAAASAVIEYESNQTWLTKPILMPIHEPDHQELLREAATELRALAGAEVGGEIVAYRWFRNGEPTGHWFDGKPSERQFQAQRQCAGIADWTVQYAYSGPPGSGRGGAGS